MIEVTIWNQFDANTLIPELLKRDGERVVRCELKGPVDLTALQLTYGPLNALAGTFVFNGEADDVKPMNWGGGSSIAPAGTKISRVIVEGGKHPMHPDWVGKLRDDCKAAGVAYEFRGWGAYVEVSPDTYAPDGGPVVLDPKTDRSSWVAGKSIGISIEGEVVRGIQHMKPGVAYRHMTLASRVVQTVVVSN